MYLRINLTIIEFPIHWFRRLCWRLLLCHLRCMLALPLTRLTLAINYLFPVFVMSSQDVVTKVLKLLLCQWYKWQTNKQTKGWIKRHPPKSYSYGLGLLLGQGSEGAGGRKNTLSTLFRSTPRKSSHKSRQSQNGGWLRFWGGGCRCRSSSGNPKGSNWSQFQAYNVRRTPAHTPVEWDVRLYSLKILSEPSSLVSL